MTDKLALPTLIALCSIALGKPVVSNLAVLGDITTVSYTHLDVYKRQVLHTQSREYIVDDLLDVMKERGVEV